MVAVLMLIVIWIQYCASDRDYADADRDRGWDVRQNERKGKRNGASTVVTLMLTQVLRRLHQAYPVHSSPALDRSL